MQATRETTHLPVLIIGAGPTGLTLANELARRNINIRIIDRFEAHPIGSRAKGLQPRSLEIMADLGIAKELIAAGATDVVFRRFNGNELLGDVKPETFLRHDTRYLKGVLLPQWKVEEILRAKLRLLGVEVELDTELIDFLQSETEVNAILRSPRGEESVNCAYMVGCDGGKSKVRKTLGIKFEGETLKEEQAFVGDVEVDGLTPDAWHIWMHPEMGFGFSLCPFACSPSWQVQTMAEPNAEGELVKPDLQTFNRLFAERTGMTNVILKNVTWASLYRVNVRMADRFRAGRVFIAGDAAHVHSIAGGLGMNTGIQDAYNLAWKLAHVINDHADEHLLNTYEEERLPIAAWALNISTERHRVVADAIKKGGDGSLHNIATKDTTQLNLNYRFSSLSSNTSNEQNGIQPGDRAPDSLLSDGSWLSDIYRGTHFTVLRSDVSTPAGILATSFGDRVREFHLPKNLLPLFERTSASYVVRPDGYIGLIADAGDEVAVYSYISKFLPSKL